MSISLSLTSASWAALAPALSSSDILAPFSVVSVGSSLYVCSRGVRLNFKRFVSKLYNVFFFIKTPFRGLGFVFKHRDLIQSFFQINFGLHFIRVIAERINDESVGSSLYVCSNQTPTYRGTLLIRNSPPQDPVVGICLGHMAALGRGAVSYERGTPCSSHR